MAFYEEAEQAADKLTVKVIKDQFDDMISQANIYIDKVVNNRYGDLSKNMDRINLLKTRLLALKTKYNLPAVDDEIDGYISIVDSEIVALQARWNIEVYDILNL